MTPNVDAILSNASAVTAIVNAATQIWRSAAPQGTPRPYIVWSITSAVPENNLSAAPEIDFARISIDCYSNSQDQANTLGKAAQDAIEAQTHVILGPLEFYEPDTKLYRYTFDAAFWTPRA